MTVDTDLLLNTAVVLAVLIPALFLWSQKVRQSKIWQAMTTPLASIIGSGFLVLGPILGAAYGQYAPLVMGVLCAGAYGYGAIIRYNISTFNAEKDQDSKLATELEAIASWALGFAYIISVTYYLNLFGSFSVSLTDVDDPFAAKLISSAVFLIILFVGWTRGFKSLEHMEYVSVTAKLAIICGLLLGLGVYFFGKAVNGGLIINPPNLTGWPAITLVFGLIVTVQGFETSRYLRDDYSDEICIRSMRRAQLLSSAIYMTYVLLLTYVFRHADFELSETSIVEMMNVVAPILPLLLVAAALAAQFSAAIADTSGAGGLIVEQSRHHIRVRMAYGLVVGIGLLLTWSANVFEIISYASRAFAFYYALQAAIATRTSWRANNYTRSALCFAMVILGVLIVMFGQPIEV